MVAVSLKKKKTDQHFRDAKKIYEYLVKKEYHSIAINLEYTPWCVIDIDDQRKAVQTLGTSYAEKSDFFFLSEKTPRGFHLWSYKPKSRTFPKKTKIKASNVAGLYSDCLINSLCILPLGKNRNVTFFNDARKKQLSSIFWPVSGINNEHSTVIVKGQRYKTLINRLINK